MEEIRVVIGELVVILQLLTFGEIYCLSWTEDLSQQISAELL